MASAAHRVPILRRQADAAVVEEAAQRFPQFRLPAGRLPQARAEVAAVRRVEPRVAVELRPLVRRREAVADVVPLRQAPRRSSAPSWIPAPRWLRSTVCIRW